MRGWLQVQARNMIRMHAENDWDLPIAADGKTMGQMLGEHGIKRGVYSSQLIDSLTHSISIALVVMM